MATRRVDDIGEGPLLPVEGPRGARIRRRLLGISGEVVGFVLVTVLLPLLLLAGLVADLVFRVRDGKPATGARLAAFLWWFLAVELFAMSSIGAIWLASGGPFGGGSMLRRRGIYWLRPRWARAHLGGFKLLFDLRVEVEGLEVARPGPMILMIRHASIADNLIPDTTVALRQGFGLRFVVKRELEALPAIDIGGRWIPTQFLNRASGDPEAETARMVTLTEDLGQDEALVIFPEGTRATAAKIARVKEKIREGQPEIAHLADRMVNLLPPRLTGPLALLEAAPDLDVVLCRHVGFDGYEHIRDIWRGGLNGATVRVRFDRVPAAEIPRDEQGRIEWLYEKWAEIDRWVGEQRAELGIGPAPESPASQVGSAA